MTEQVQPTLRLDAVKTKEGFIEITSLNELDKLVGGLLDHDDAYCDLVEDSSIKNDPRFK